MNGSGGDLKKLTGETSVSNQPAWSPDGTKLAYQYGQHDIVIMNDDGTGKTNLTQNLGNPGNPVYADGNPVWSPDGARIAFQRDIIAEKQEEVYVMNANGTGMTNLSHDPDATDSLPSWSPDGTRIAFLKNDTPYVVNADGSGTPLPLISTAPIPGSGGSRPAWSPDGTRIAFVLDYDIAVVAPDGTGLAKLTHEGVSAQKHGPIWTPDGSRLYFLSGGGEIRVVNADGTGNQLVATNATGSDLSLTSDGVRLAFVRDVAPAPIGTCCGNAEVFKTYTDGTGQVNLSNSTGPDFYPVWRP
jgi:TolB protein